MSDSNRIHQTSIAQTTPRQTPQNDFGQVMARTLSSAVQTGAGVAGTLAVGSPVLSAAVSRVTSAISAVVPVGSQGQAQSLGGIAGTGGAGAVPGAGGELSQQDILKAQHSMNMEYLHLQMAMQQESREYQALSNVMKVRHDSAKAAINNIR